MTAEWASVYDLPQHAEDAPRATVVRLSDVRPEKVTWLWPGYLPLGKLVVLDGDPSTGKSTLTTDLAARCSTGSAWPDGSRNTEPRGVVMLSAEDGLADTIAPRLAAAGADRTKVGAMTQVWIGGDDDGHAEPPSLPRDIPHIEEAVRRYGAALVVVDVLMAYLGGGIDAHRDQDVRGALAQLAAMAERTGCCVILLRHLNKTGNGSPLYRGGGSIGIVGAARAAYLVGRDPQDSDRRILACTKSNLAAEPPALAYRLVDSPDHGCARVEWDPSPVDGMTAAVLLHGAQDDDERTERDEAAAWLVDYLTTHGGEAPANEVERAAGAAGFSRDQVKRVKHQAGVVSSKSSWGAGWVWRLTEGSTKGAKSAARNGLLPSTPSGDEALPSESPGPTPPRCRGCGLPLPPDPALVFDGCHVTCEPQSHLVQRSQGVRP